MEHSEYKQAKILLKSYAEYLKNKTNDKPLIRMEINDEVDRLCKNFPASIGFKRSEMYRNWLSSYAVKLHP